MEQDRGEVSATADELCSPLQYALPNITQYVLEKLGERCAMVSFFLPICPLSIHHPKTKITIFPFSLPLWCQLRSSMV